MRLRRISLRNVRGVAERELVLVDGVDTCGVVVIEGPNEAGKSTLGDALDALLSHKASARNADVRSLQSEGIDEPPEVEAELELGGYRLTYRKRYLRRPSTELTIVMPRGEQLTGDEAHERMATILDAEVDMALWRALRVTQDGSELQPPLAHAPGLASALRRRGNTTAIGDRELHVLEAARSGYDEFFTAKEGRPRPVLRDADAAVADARAALAAVEERRRTLEEDVRRTERLEAELPSLRRQATEARERADELAERRRALDELRDRGARLEDACGSAADAVANLHERRERRNALAAGVLSVKGDADELARRLVDVEAEERDTHARVAATRQRLEELASARRDARAARLRAEDELAVLRASAELSELSRRLDAATRASAALRTATAEHDRIAVDDAVLEELRGAQRRLDLTRASRDAARPRLTFTAERPIDVHDGEGRRRLGRGESARWAVRAAVNVHLEGVGDVQVRAGSDEERADDDVHAAEDALGEVLERAGTGDLVDAERLHRRRAQCAADAVEARRRLESELGERSLEELASAVAERRGLLEASESGHRLAAGPEDVADAERALADAVRAQDAADDALAAPQAQLEELRRAHEAAREAAIEVRSRLDEVRRRAGELARQLDEDREQASDAALDTELTQARRRHARAVAERDRIDEELTTLAADGLDEVADNAEQVAKDLGERVAGAQAEVQDLRTALRIRGGDGLWERRAELTGRLDHAEAEAASLWRRADAARTLFETLDRHRTAAQQRYAAPLREEVLAAGRLLFGGDFDVELDADLTVARRHRDGVWLRFDQLSAGAQEQLALLTRLACARLLDERGGLLFFDDALGNTDPERLERLGAVLRVAGGHTQILVLTCTPERFRHVGGARRLRL